MKKFKCQIADAETKIVQQLWDKFFAELRKETGKRDKVRAVLDDIKAYQEISRAFVADDDMSAVKKLYRDNIAILDHHLPECAARIREQIPWL